MVGVRAGSRRSSARPQRDDRRRELRGRLLRHVVAGGQQVVSHQVGEVGTVLGDGSGRVEGVGGGIENHRRHPDRRPGRDESFGGLVQASCNLYYRRHHYIDLFLGNE